MSYEKQEQQIISYFYPGINRSKRTVVKEEQEIHYFLENYSKITVRFSLNDKKNIHGNVFISQYIKSKDTKEFVFSKFIIVGMIQGKKLGHCYVFTEKYVVHKTFFDWEYPDIPLTESLYENTMGMSLPKEFFSAPALDGNVFLTVTKLRRIDYFFRVDEYIFSLEYNVGVSKISFEKDIIHVNNMRIIHKEQEEDYEKLCMPSFGKTITVKQKKEDGNISLVFPLKTYYFTDGEEKTFPLKEIKSLKTLCRWTQ